MPYLAHHDSNLEGVRTTVNLDDDVMAAVSERRHKNGAGLSEALNDLVRAGLVSANDPRGTRSPFKQRTYQLGARVDVTNVGEVLELLDNGAE